MHEPIASQPNPRLTNDIELLLDALPPAITASLLNEDTTDLLEVILDLGRLPEARYRSHERFLSDHEVTRADLDMVITHIGEFGEDNRAGIPRTLHRISAIRNRQGEVIGLTCRVGRAMFGTVTIIRDLVETGNSILLLGRPGTGKTTLLRETARVLAEDLRKRVVIVDTSNEIAGDGDIPHSGIGRARRMQVARPSAQHAVMIEAVENHMPEVVVIDEIGTELEAQAARTIAERGVQLIGTAHGNTLDNLMVNPTLSDLIGGIQAVTLGDEEARRRGTQKTVLERKAPPTFDMLVEIQAWDRVIVYNDVASAVDAVLRGEELQAEQRVRDADGQVQVSTAPPRERERMPGRGTASTTMRSTSNGRSSRERAPRAAAPRANTTQRIFPFGVSRNRLEDAIERLGVPAVIVRELAEASLVMTLKNYYRQSSQRLRQAEERGVPVYVLRNNTATQIERQLATIFQIEVADDEAELVPAYADTRSVEEVLIDTEKAIDDVINGARQEIELPPQNRYIRRLQHQLADRYNLQSESYGSEPHRRVRISR